MIRRTTTTAATAEPTSSQPNIAVHSCPRSPEQAYLVDASFSSVRMVRPETYPAVAYIQKVGVPTPQNTLFPTAKGEQNASGSFHVGYTLLISFVRHLLSINNMALFKSKALWKLISFACCTPIWACCLKTHSVRVMLLSYLQRDTY